MGRQGGTSCPSWEFCQAKPRAKLVGLLASYDGVLSYTFPEDFDTFYLREGKIKHFLIKLKKEAILIVKKKVKLPDRSFNISNINVWITYEKFNGSFEAYIKGDGVVKKGSSLCGCLKTNLIMIFLN